MAFPQGVCGENNGKQRKEEGEVGGSGWEVPPSIARAYEQPIELPQLRHL
ncbi:MAG: hypothetical protein QOG31_1619 [Thermoplasmata archaeon]|jgi:hypothetical protein|nr:hypothetical protein [Thermoplasmata archaeon]